DKPRLSTVTHPTMAGLRAVPRSTLSLPTCQLARTVHATPARRRTASTQASDPSLHDLETSTLSTPQLEPEAKLAFRPWKRAADRKLALPGSRYQYHPPRFNRGPLHPIQSPPASDPVARDFVPG